MEEYIRESIKTKERILEDKKLLEEIKNAADAIIRAYKRGNKVLTAGNGGSAGDAQHIAGELVAKFKYVRKGLSAFSLWVNSSVITAVANDYGYEHVFSRPLRGIGKKGDVLVGISTSGSSKNILEAFKTAKELGIKTVAFTGKSGGEMIKEADITLNVPSDITNNIQEMHIASGHIICGIVEQHFFG